MLFGPKPGTIVRVQPVDIHGTRMLDIVYKLDAETGARSARMGLEALYGEPYPGDRVLVHLLMDVVTRIDRAGP
jgi:hypothetical protein